MKGQIMFRDLIGQFVVWQSNKGRKGRIVAFQKKGEASLNVIVEMDGEIKPELKTFAFPDAFVKEPYHLALENGSSIYNCYNTDEDIKYINCRDITNRLNDIKYFFHYTDIKNLTSILYSGFLFSRNAMRGKVFHDAANEDVIIHTKERVKDYVRFFYKEKTPTIYNNAGIKKGNDNPHMPVPVVLLFDRAIMLHDNVLFADGSGSNRLTRFTKSFEEALNYDWNEIFNRNAYQTPRNNNISEEAYKLIKNHRNAEFLYPEKISLKYLKKIVFRSKSEFRLGMKLLGYNELFSVDGKKEYFYFGHTNIEMKRNFVLDYTIRNRIDMVGLIIKYDNEDIEGYDHKLEVELIHKTEIVNCMPYINEEGNYEIIYKIPGFEIVKKLNYYMNGHLCITWENK